MFAEFIASLRARIAAFFAGAVIAAEAIAEDDLSIAREKSSDFEDHVREAVETELKRFRNKV